MKAEVKKKTVRKTGLMIPVYDPTGKVEKELELPKTIFSVKTSPKLLAHYVRVFLVNQRQGTASTKTRGDVTGSTRKIYRQKGTGRARHGDIKAPIFVGGGIVGGPKPKKYFLKINKKQKNKAFLGALTLRYETKGLIGLSDKFLTIEPKTKNLAEFFKKINLEKDKKLLIIPKQEKNNLILAAKNIPTVTVVEAESVNSYQILNHQKVLILVKAVEVIKKHKEKNEN